MPDRIEENFLDNSTNTQSENLSDRIPPTNYAENIPQNQEPENMEVHHHTHDPAAPHHNKKLEILLLGIFNVVPCCALWVFSRISIGT